MLHNRILIAEDDRGSRALLRDAFRHTSPPLTLAIARTRAEFMRNIDSHAFDCVVMNTTLVDCSADELINLLRRRHPDCPAVIVSSESDRGIALRAVRRGAVEIMRRDEAATGDCLEQRVRGAIEVAQRKHRDRRRRQRREQRPFDGAERDPDTGLLSRATVERLFQHTDRRTFDRRGHSSIVVLELDGGAAVDAAVLRLVAEALRQVSAPGDATCRWSKARMLALRPEAPFARAMFQAEQLRRRIAALPVRAAGHRTALTACLGVASVRSDVLGADTIALAEATLDAARADGRNRVWSSDRARAAEVLRQVPPGALDARINDLLQRLAEPVESSRRLHLLRTAARVADVGAAIARLMRLDARTVERVRLAGRARELGTLCAPADVTTGAAIPEAERRHLDARLAADAAELAAALGADRETVECVRLQHLPFCELERAETETGHVPVGARIVHAAQALVAMTSDRSAHTRTAQDTARDTLREQSGRRFDPSVVEAALAVELSQPEDLFLRLLESGAGRSPGGSPAEVPSASA